MIRKLAVFLCLMLAVTAWGFAAEPAAVRIMTQNMDAGTDLTFAVAELRGILPPGVGVELTYEEILATNIPQRTALLAARVAAKKPDLLALQEVTLWRTGASVDMIARPMSWLINSNCCSPTLPPPASPTTSWP
jgi:hypothetical protein